MNILFATIIAVILGLAFGVPFLVAGIYDRKREKRLEEAAASQALTQYLRGSK